MTRQLALPLAYRVGQGVADFFVSDANRDAFRHLAEWRRWPAPVTLLLGPRESGKSHLARIFAARSGGRVIDDAGPGLDEEHLVHRWNAASPGQPLLIVSRAQPRDWPVRLPDLASRLEATVRVAIQPPDDALLAALMRKRFRDLGVEVSPGVVDFTLARIERSFAGVARAVETLDAAALEQRCKVSIPLARTVIVDAAQQDWLAQEDGAR
jgi:chromosomal replication initiation ATPase DnaA